jgi:hypothetical protein
MEKGMLKIGWIQGRVVVVVHLSVWILPGVEVGKPEAAPPAGHDSEFRPSVEKAAVR